jgi:hypothetical protein
MMAVIYVADLVWAFVFWTWALVGAIRDARRRPHPVVVDPAAPIDTRLSWADLVNIGTVPSMLTSVVVRWGSAVGVVNLATLIVVSGSIVFPYGPHGPYAQSWGRRMLAARHHAKMLRRAGDDVRKGTGYRRSEQGE